MTMMELVELMKKDDPIALGRIPDGRVARIVRAAFVQIGRQIDAVDEGVVGVPGFGVFRARQVERKKDDQIINLKLIIFRPIEAGVGKGKRSAK